MRHRISGRKLGVTTKHRKAMFRNMATDLLRHGRINTTDTRAKEIRRVVEKLITLGKNGSLHARRKALGYVRDRDVVEKLFSELAERYMQRPGGYTRIVKLGYRRGDNAPVSLVELVTEEFKAKKKKKKKSASKAVPKAKAEAKKSSKKKSAEELGLVEGEPEAAAEPEAAEATEPSGAEKKTETTEKPKASPKPKEAKEAEAPSSDSSDAEEKAKPAEKPEASQESKEAKEAEAPSSDSSDAEEKAEPAEKPEASPEAEAASPETEEKAQAAPAEDSEAGEPDSSEEKKD